MKARIIIFCMLLSMQVQAQDKRLYLVMKNGLYGYIDGAGHVVVRPQFLSAGEFSEGVAAVRVKGTYGYIDKSGRLVIPGQYDQAMPFCRGIARVFINGKPYFIDKKGTILFQHDYERINGFGQNRYSIVNTVIGREGVIDRTGKLVIDTIFQRISGFYNGVAIVTGFGHHPYAYKDTERLAYEVGIVDTLGNWVVPYGIYKSIDHFQAGFAEAELINSDPRSYDRTVVIDTRGNSRFTIPRRKWNPDYSKPGFYQNLAIVRIYAVDPDTIHIWSSNNRYHYMGVVDTNGNIIASDLSWVQLTPFINGRAFATKLDEKKFLVNTRGQLVTPQAFDEVLAKGYDGSAGDIFRNGMAFVRTAKGWGVIDTNGKFIVEPRWLGDRDWRDYTRVGNLVVFSKDISLERKGYSFIYGFWDPFANTIVKPQFRSIKEYYGPMSLIGVADDKCAGYVNAKGKWIWKGDQVSSSNKLDIDYMNRAYYYASSYEVPELNSLGGWYDAGHYPSKVDGNTQFAPGKLQIVIDTAQRTRWAEKFNGVKLYLANTAGDTFFFNAEDSRIGIVMQAMDRNGIWRDIEFLPRSWCGNSYHTLYLAPGQFWEFSTPLYYGEYKTRLRARLVYKLNMDRSDKSEQVIYSNEIYGYVNPGQFWYKREYYSKGLMDPYDE